MEKITLNEGRVYSTLKGRQYTAFCNVIIFRAAESVSPPIKRRISAMNGLRGFDQEDDYKEHRWEFDWFQCVKTKLQISS